MLAAVQDVYGGPEVVTVQQVADPTAGPGQLLVRVIASAVTTADTRIRAADFPTGMRLLGRLALGWYGPRQRVRGVVFAGRVEAIGADAAGFAVGDEVFGFGGAGGHGELLTVAATGCVAKKPATLSFEEAAAVPFGGLTALTLLRDVLHVRSGASVLVIGAAGECGLWMVQIARHLGLQVTASCASAGHELVRSVGAHHVVGRVDGPGWEERGPYDVVVDAVGSIDFTRARRLLRRTGQFLPLVACPSDTWAAVWTRFTRGPRVVFAVGWDHQDDLQEVAELLGRGALRPVVDSTFALADVRDAYRRVEGRGKHGTVVVQVGR